MSAAVEALRQALLAGLDPSKDPARMGVDVSAGQLLFMPAETGRRVGIKIVGIAPSNPGRGLERIQAVYVLSEADTLIPIAFLDGVAITSLRTPAVSALAANFLAARSVAPVNTLTLVVFGTGPQARGHIQALACVRDLDSIVVVGRNAVRTRAFVDELVLRGLDATVGSPRSVEDAQLVVCATTASEPLFDGSLLRSDCCVLAVGSHLPNARELDGTLMARAQVVVEDVATALREAGDVVIASRDRQLQPASLVTLSDVVTGKVKPDLSRPRVFKSVGMAWQDLVIANEVYNLRQNLPR